MMTSDDKVGGWVKKGQNHDDVILEWSPMEICGNMSDFSKYTFTRLNGLSGASIESSPTWCYYN